MKVIYSVFCVQVILGITVPPRWPQTDQITHRNDKISYKNPTVQSTQVPLDSEPYKLYSFYPADAKPSSTVTKLQYRSPNYAQTPNNQQLFVYHPQSNTQNKKYENHTPSSYQLVHFDNKNQQIIKTIIPRVTAHKQTRNGKYIQPIRQHLTETNPPVKTFIPKQKEDVKHIVQEEIKESTEENTSEDIEDNKEFSPEVPTRPIYPGEGQWAKFGLKHHPYIRPNVESASIEHSHKPHIRPNIKYASTDVEYLENVKDAPEGYETFEKGQKQFNQAQNNHKYNIQRIFMPSEIIPSESKPTEIGFIPEKLYTQVRRTESEEHLPRSAINPDEENADRLRETIKDSKIHTVYTEEGYEDSAYDHAGHEKNAENHEGHAENHEDESKKSGKGHGGNRKTLSRERGRRYGGNNERRRSESSDTKNNKDYINSKGYRNTGRRNREDIDAAGSEYDSKKVNPIIPSKNIKKVTLKNGKNEDIHMEIHTEVKYTPQKKKHKYVKIVPSSNKNSEISTLKSSLVESSTESLTTDITKINITKPESSKTESAKTKSDGTESSTPLKRVKRYDKAKLSKMYKRQRPSYYWKKIITTSTVRPIVNSRKNFEEAFQTHNTRVFEDYEDTPRENIFKSSNKRRKTKLEATEKKTTKLSPKTITTSTTIPENITPTETTTDKLTTSKDKTIKTMVKTSEKEKKTKAKTMQDTSTKENKTNENKTIELSTISTIKEDIHPDLLNPELTTRISKPSSPKILPVKIRKFKTKRQKRFTNDFPNIKVDLNEFTDVRKFPDPVITPDMTHIKYPYYNLPEEDLNENSPLRYGEDMKNIPKKIENQLSFYESKEHIVCPEIETDVNPIPERIQKQKEGEETDKMAESPDLPRLKGLGDKIDCLKEKYFGVDPLDSPFFREETIQEPKPFFFIKPNKQSKQYVDNTPDIVGNAVKRELKIKILEPIVVLEEDLIESATINPIHQNTEAVLKPPYTLLEMMTMNQEQFVTPPRNIFDQISFLKQNEKSSTLPQDQFIIIYDNQDVSKLEEKSTTTELPQKEDKMVRSTLKPQATIRKPQIHKLPMPIKKLSAKTIRKPTPKTTQKPSTTTTATIPTISTPVLSTSSLQLPTNNLNKTITVQSSLVNPVVIPNNPVLTPTTSELPKNSPSPILIKPMVRPNKWQAENRRLSSFYNIFDISRFLPKVPKHRWVTNEDQINIHSDVLQNINNEQENKDASDTKLEAVKVPVPQKLITVETTSKITEQPISQSTGTVASMLAPSSSSATEVELQPDASQSSNYYYSTILNEGISSTKHIISKRDTRKLNKKRDDLEDLLMEETKLSPTNIRFKRNIKQNEDDLQMDETENRPVYSAPPSRKPKVYTEIVRQKSVRPPEDIEEEEEDLNPRKRIYQLKSSRTPTSTLRPAPLDEEFLEEVLTEPPEPTTTLKPIIYPVEANSKNSSVAQYIFLIEKLQEKWAKEDATSTTEATTTTKNPTKTISNQVTAESINVRRGEPAYLQIISHLHDIQMKEDLSTTSTTESSTTEYQTPVKNSNPFIYESFMSELNSMKAKLDPDSTAESSNKESVDTSIDTVRSRNFSTRFKTNIDTSKYKTIERAPVNVRHNLSSRFNSDEGLPLQKDKTTKTPMIIAIISRPTTKIPEKIEDNKGQAQELSSTTVNPRQRGRSRRVFYTTTSRPSTVTSSATSVTPVTTNPNFRRRRPTRVTTTTPPSTTKPETYRRRNNRQRLTTPPTTKEHLTTESVVVVTPVSSYKKESLEPSEEFSEPKQQRRFQKVQERHVMSEVTLTRFFEPGSDELDDTSEETRKHQYEVIGPLKHLDTLHGGNYKHERDRKHPNSSDEDITEIPESVASSESFFTDPKLAEDVNQLKDDKKISAEKKEASNILLTQEEIEDKGTEKASKVHLFPNVARMINRLADYKDGEVSNIGEENNKEEDNNKEEKTERPTFIKDPSRRMYYYAKL